ncbi:NAD(P)-dependent oxidoreductase [Salinigranum marinum]|uniref:NAD-dependent epimerase/dehydratase family protein n=1 Tax=Salinigranum marinum TaxID=1515595 RepID=UPI002989B06E|nr:NAD(P)-dependent oxidoreductase [Salinigranum marinum]
MRTLLTGAHGTVGTALTGHLGDVDLTLFDRRQVDQTTEWHGDGPHPHADRAAIAGDVADAEAVRAAVEGHDAVVHLAGYPRTDGTWEEVLKNNVVGTRTVLDAAVAAGVERVVFASSNHVVGMYEREHAPGIYHGTDLEVDHTVPYRPDSPYGSSKAACEVFGREYAENRGLRFYAVRIGSVRPPAYDHPYGDAERGVDEGRWSRGSDAYREQAARMKATWLSRRDCAALFDCCLRDSSVGYDVFYGVSDNERRWFDLDHARDVVGYDPRDDGERWDGPPAARGSTE